MEGGGGAVTGEGGQIHGALLARSLVQLAAREHPGEPAEQDGEGAARPCDDAFLRERSNVEASLIQELEEALLVEKRISRKLTVQTSPSGAQDRPSASADSATALDTGLALGSPESSRREALRAAPVSVDEFRRHVRWGGLCFRKLSVERVFLDQHARLHICTMYIGYGVLLLAALVAPTYYVLDKWFLAWQCQTWSKEVYNSINARTKEEKQIVG